LEFYFEAYFSSIYHDDTDVKRLVLDVTSLIFGFMNSLDYCAPLFQIKMDRAKAERLRIFGNCESINGEILLMCKVIKNHAKGMEVIFGTEEWNAYLNALFKLVVLFSFHHNFTCAFMNSNCFANCWKVVITMLRFQMGDRVGGPSSASIAFPSRVTEFAFPNS
jgi:hypothetical protein